MTKQILLLLTLLPLIGFGQTTTLSSADVDSDGCVTVSDVLGVLQFYGQCSEDLNLERTWYYFHGIDNDWLAYAGGSLFDATLYGLMDGSGLFTGTSTTDFSVAFDYYLSSSDSLDCGYEIQTLEFPIGGSLDDISGTFPALICGAGPGDADYNYLVVPDNNLTPNLIEYGVVYTSPGCGTVTAGRLGFEINGVPYWIYQMSGGTVLGSVGFSFP